MMKSISRKAAHDNGWVPRLVGLLFLLPGGLVFYFFSVIPMSNWYNAQDWVETSCTITGSSVGRHDSSDGGPTYSIDIRYTYVWSGETFAGDRYNFFGGSSSGHSAKAAVVGRYPVGSTQICFVNPDSPEESALNRDFSFVYLIGCFGFIFMLLGLYLLVARQSSKKKSLSAGEKVQRVSAPDYAGQESVTLKAGNNRFLGLILVSVFGIFWNGIVLVALGNFLGGDGGALALLPVLFLVPFVLVGLAFIVGMGYMFLALFNPRPELILSPGHLPLGGTATVAWSFQGNTSRIQKLCISVTGTETATYRRGTNTVTDRSIFERIDLIETLEPREIARGEVSFRIPEFSAPSFDAKNNTIKWQLKVEGDIPRWPDVSQEFEFTVAPLPPQSGGVTPRLAEFRTT